MMLIFRHKGLFPCIAVKIDPWLKGTAASRVENLLVFAGNGKKRRLGS
ncbi:MAG: hypothetical protein Ct9H300mP19_10990 [Dehalococcoidia bacterium]|nr:MAG: hypothetical protein Ct9H300mP19_10990 [Dehalococcoidia bacterium]